MYVHAYTHGFQIWTISVYPLCSIFFNILHTYCLKFVKAFSCLPLMFIVEMINILAGAGFLTMQ